MGKQYIVKGAMAQCNQSKVPMIAQLNLIPDNMFVNMNGNPVATTMTLGPVFGPAPFGICNMIPPTPAVPTPPCVCAILSWSGGGHGRQDQHDLQPADDGQQRNVRFGRFHLLQNVRAIPEAQHTAYTDTRCGGYERGGHEAEAGTEKEESLTSS